MSATAAAADWGIFVNECAIFANGIAKDRWIDFTLRAKRGRLVPLRLGPGGGEWHVMCGTKEAATEAHELFLEVGFHKNTVKVARLSACQAKVEKHRAEVRARLAGVR
jgi:hypothetical protein